MKKVLDKIKKTRIYKFIDRFNNIDKEYYITTTAASITFYTLLSVISLLLLAFQILNYSSNIIETFIIPKVFDVFTNNFGEQINQMLPKFTLNSFSILVLINILWSSSKAINAINKISDTIYKEIKPRNGLMNRISAFFMFSMLMLVLVFEIIIVFLSEYIITEVLHISYPLITQIWQIIVEVLVIFFVVLILYIYAPPRRTKVKEAFPGALFTTICVYLILLIFVFIIDLYKDINPAYGIMTIISLSLIVLFVMDYVIILGILINYQKLKGVKFTNLLFSKK